MSDNTGDDLRAVWLERYERAAHAVQSAVAYMIGAFGLRESAADPKHLRVGLNLSKADHAALAELLISKGIISDEEYTLAIIKRTEQEAELQANEARKMGGLPQTVKFE